jgi:NAD(P)-dependent dehydrogenase (short-subunit alcohol dehydrogenase family)
MTTHTHAFNGKVALVTGAAAGIGRASALAFARGGARVVAADVQTAAGEETVTQIKSAGGEAVFIRADVSVKKDVEALMRQTITLYGRLDCAHNNAGVEGVRARTASALEKDWDQTIAVNLKGVWLCMKYEISQMLKLGQGAIVNTSSVAGHVGLSRFGAYSASKHAVLGLTKSAALEYMRFGIRINAVCPGYIDTGMLDRALIAGHASGSFSDRLLKGVRKRLSRAALLMQQPARRTGSPAEVAEAVVWLCSDSASFVNGHNLVVDGGYLAQ